MTPALELNTVGLRLGTGPEVVADIELVLAPGAVAALVGPAHAGKSLVLELAGLARRPGRGAVRLFGTDPWSSTERRRALLRRRLGWVEQRRWRVPGLDAVADVALPLQIAGLAPAPARERARELLDWLGGVPAADAGPEADARVAVARAMVHGPELVLVDALEDFDQRLLERLLTLADRLGRQGTAFLAATRDEALAGRLPGATLLRLGGAAAERRGAPVEAAMA